MLLWVLARCTNNQESHLAEGGSADVVIELAAGAAVALSLQVGRRVLAGAVRHVDPLDDGLVDVGVVPSIRDDGLQAPGTRSAAQRLFPAGCEQGHAGV